MLFRYEILVVLIISVSLCSAVDYPCPPYEEYRECTSACSASCSMTGYHSRTMEILTHSSCSMSQCVSGCFCQAGFVRDENTLHCIPEDQCPLDLSCQNMDCGFGGLCNETTDGPVCIAAELCTNDTCPGDERCFDTKEGPLCLETEVEGVDLCDFPAERGPCEANLLRFWYRPDLGTCDRFQYGGCRGNENNFDTFDKCMQHCYTG